VEIFAVDITPKNKINVALTRTRDPTRLDSDLPGGGVYPGGLAACMHSNNLAVQTAGR